MSRLYRHDFVAQSDLLTPKGISTMKIWKRSDPEDQSMLGGGKTNSDAKGVLKSTPAGSGTAATDAESAVTALGQGNAQQRDIDARNKIGRGIKKLTKASGTFRRRVAATGSFRQGLPGRTLAVREKAQFAQETTLANETKSPQPLLMSLVALACAEMVLLVAEFAFYYDMFTRSMQKDAAWIQRAGKIILAVLVPVMCLMMARAFAGSVHQVCFPADTAPGRHSKRARWTALIFISAGFVGMCVATWYLVYWRFASESEASFGLIQSLPPLPIAAVFVVGVSGDALVRAFLLPPTKHSDRHRSMQIRFSRFLDALLTRREVRALDKWHAAWTSLQMFVNTLLDNAEQSVLTAEELVLLHRAEQSNVAALSDRAVTAHTSVVDREKRAGTDDSAAAAIIPRHFDLPCIWMQLRNAETALAHLKNMKPPLHQQQSDIMLAGMEGQVEKIADYLNSHLDPTPKTTVDGNGPEVDDAGQEKKIQAV